MRSWNKLSRKLQRWRRSWQNSHPNKWFGVLKIGLRCHLGEIISARISITCQIIL